MKPTEETFKKEIEHRISLLESRLKNESDKLLFTIFSNEHSMLSEIFELFKTFENRLGYDEFHASNFTPILDGKTNEPLKIGDLVDNGAGQCGILSFNNLLNQYVIKTDTGHFRTNHFYKIPKLYDYEIDTKRVECRKPNRYLKQRW